MITETMVRPNKQTLEELYLDKRLSCQSIAKLHNCALGTIRNHLLKYGIPIRSRSEAAIGKHCVATNLTPDQLSHLYRDEGYSQQDIAHQVSAHEDTIRSRMKEWGIPVRPKTAPRTERHSAKRSATITRKNLKTLEQIKDLPQRKFEVTPDYIVGLTDSEGSFSIYIDFRWNPPIPQCEFSVSNTHELTLHMVKDFLGFGFVYPDGHRRDGYTRKACYNYCVHGIRKQVELAKFFLEHPLSIKQSAFKAWLRVLTLIAENKHVTDEGLREIIYLKETMNRRPLNAYFRKHNQSCKIST